MTCRHAAAVDASVGVGPAPGVAPEVVTPDVVAHVVARLHPFARADVSLASLTTYRVGGRAAVFATPRSLEELVAVADAAADAGLPLLVVGRGSNMLVADTGFGGIAVSLVDMAGHVAINDDQVACGAAVALPVLARRTAAAGLTGFEWAVGVPGSIGGAVRMNAGGHGADIAACLISATVFDTERLVATDLPAEALGLAFRSSALGDGDIVIAARLQLAPGDRQASETEIAEIVRWRREHQPGGQNAGSVFVNPLPGELSAAELIDRLELRGYSIGGASVSRKHANFIQAEPGASAADVRSVMEHVRARVASATGFVLRSEVRLVGFADPDPAGVGPRADGAPR